MVEVIIEADGTAVVEEVEVVAEEPEEVVSEEVQELESILETLP